MWIVKLALSRPYTFVVASLAILVFGVMFAYRIPKDMFPNINTPVISVVWSYSGMTAKEFEERITSFSEFALSSTVNGIESIESQTLNGQALIRLYFHPDTEVQGALAQVTAISQYILWRLPAGITPPTIVVYSPSTVPIAKIMISSESVPEQNLYDYATFRFRHFLAEIQGLTIPPPFGGKMLELMIDTYPEALQARGLSPADVMDSINRQNIIIPTGDAKIGSIDYLMNANNTLEKPDDYNNIPISAKDGSIIYLRDVGFAHEGFPPQVNIVRDQGHRSVMLSILKNGNTSILKTIEQVKEKLPVLRAAAPEGIKIDLQSDQSIFVKEAIGTIFREGMLACLIVGALILFFLRSWINTAAVVVSIPLSVMATIIVLELTGQSLNSMTLGGLTLSIGVLVDNATITVENIHRNLALGKSLERGVFDGSSQIAVPSFVSSLAICIVFLPIGLLVGSSKLLFVPFAYSAAIAIGFSYFFSRTLVPVLVRYLHKENEQKPVWFFVVLQEKYEKALSWCLENRGTVFGAFGIFFCSAFIIFPFIGTDFFPIPNSNLMRLHVKAPTGTRIEVTEEIFGNVEEEIQKILPKEDVYSISDMIGINPIPYASSFGDNSTSGPWDGEIYITTNPSSKHRAAYYEELLRTRLKERFPEYTFFFQPADLISQILYFGNPAPIDVKVIGYDYANNLEVARELIDRISRIPGVVDVHLHQDVDAPELFVNVNRLLLSQVNLMQDLVAKNLLITNSDSSVVHPNFWINKQRGLPYPIAIQTPKYCVDSIESLMRTPISNFSSDFSDVSTQLQYLLSNSLPSLEWRTSELLSNLATLERRTTPALVSHYNIQPAYDVFANIQGIDLGGASDKIQQIINDLKPRMQPGNEIRLLGITSTMQKSFKILGLGLIVSVLLIYFILVISFQSWTDPLIIVFAIPGALTGVLWTLFSTGTTINISSLIGSIVVLGLATANSILVITFANHQLFEKKTSKEAALFAGKSRLRPVLMTALAMIFGMLPIALGIGVGAQQQAPLARVVVGGLFFGTVSTLFLVPVIFSCLRKKSNPYLERL